MWATTCTRSGRDDAEVLLRAQVDLTMVAVDVFAKVAKAYWRMWGPWGAPTVEAVEAAAEVQRRYLETLRGTLG